jgi:hypothetical protein
MLLSGKYQHARELADEVLKLARQVKLERHGTRAKRLKGVAALRLGELEEAQTSLEEGLQAARAGTLVEEGGKGSGTENKEMLMIGF